MVNSEFIVERKPITIHDIVVNKRLLPSECVSVYLLDRSVDTTGEFIKGAQRAKN